MLVIEDRYIAASGYSEPELKLEIAVMLFEQEIVVAQGWFSRLTPDRFL